MVSRAPDRVGRRASRAALLLLTLSWVVPPGCARRNAPPDLLLLVTLDTLRADHLPIYGYPRDTAPFLSHLAQDAVVFERAVSAASHTAPSHASMLTGLPPVLHGVRTNLDHLEGGVAALPELLADAGYRSAAALSVRFLSGVAAGFDHVDVPEAAASGRRTAYRPAEETVAAALELRRRVCSDGGRLFLWVHLFDVHEWSAVERPDQAFTGEAQSGRSDLARRLAERAGLDPVKAGPLLLRNADRYDTQIRRIDRALRLLFEGIGDAGSVFFAVVGDHGEGLLCHGYHGHGRFLYQEQLRVPLVLGRLGAGSDGGRRVTDLVRTTDLFPTFLETAGLEPVPLPGLGEASLDARSLLALVGASGDALDGGRLALSVRRPADERRVAEGWSPGELVAVQDERFKAIVSSEGPFQLFDLGRDPYELRDLAGDPPPDAARAALRLLKIARRAFQTRPLGETHRSDVDREELRELGYVK